MIQDLREDAKRAAHELKKLEKLIKGTPRSIQASGYMCHCGSDMKAYSIKDTGIEFCEECCVYFMDNVRHLTDKIGIIFPVAVYAILAEIWIKENRLIPVKEWSPEQYEHIRDLCCINQQDIDHFSLIFVPDYMGGGKWA